MSRQGELDGIGETQPEPTEPLAVDVGSTADHAAAFFFGGVALSNAWTSRLSAW